MAGKNTRFHDSGYDVPKYLLPFSSSTVIQNIISNLNSLTIFDDIFLIAHERDIYFKTELVGALGNLGIKGENIFYVGETSGQAETAYLATKLLPQQIDCPIVFHNADTILINRDFSYLKEMLNSNDGFIDTFYANSEKYSYVQLNNEMVWDIVEKKVISKYATSGLYGFSSRCEYQKYYLELKYRIEINNNFKEMYISDVIKYMINSGKSFKTKLNSNRQNTLVLGSPMEYVEALKNFEVVNYGF